MSDAIEDTAQQIAAQGRDALVERLRPAFAEAAAAHSDVLTLDQGQLEQMVQQAADRADGLQWRRALATVASRELGIGLGEALAHPAVVRAQAIVGAPSYEQALEAVTAGRALEAVPTGAPADENGSAADHERDADASSSSQVDTVKLNAVHLGGLAGLPKGASDLELQFSTTGFGIVRGTQPLGRIKWNEITAVEIPTPGGRRRRRQKTDGTIVIRSAQGSATFEIPGLSPEELGEHLGPLLKDH